MLQLYLFTQMQYVDRLKISGIIKLPHEEIREILEQISTLKSNKGWHLKQPFDKDFVSR